MSDRWFFQHRQEWIAETFRVFGFINREHIERKFGMSTPQASVDLAAFQKAYPNAVFYNKSSKRYESKEPPPDVRIAAEAELYKLTESIDVVEQGNDGRS
jgi:hypothetical protein